MSWDEILGQPQATQFLRRSVERNRLAHAYLFTGPPGVGKALTARVFAHTILCAQREGAQRCGTCDDCRQIDRGFHPDLHFVQPENGSLRIDQVRALRQALALKPFAAEAKVAVIDDAHLLTDEAQNALLKLLEEPSGRAVLVLIAPSAASLLPTVRSRCQTVRFHPLPREQFLDHLADLGVDPPTASVLAGIAEGRIGAALAARERDVVAQREQVLRWIEALSSDRHDWRPLFEIEAQLEQKREEVDDLLHLLTLWLRDLLLLRAGAKGAVANQDLIDRLERAALPAPTADIGGALVAVWRARRRLREHAHFRLTIDVMLAQLKRSLSV